MPRRCVLPARQHGAHRVSCGHRATPSRTIRPIRVRRLRRRVLLSRRPTQRPIAVRTRLLLPRRVRCGRPVSVRRAGQVLSGRHCGARERPRRPWGAFRVACTVVRYAFLLLTLCAWAVFFVTWDVVQYYTTPTTGLRTGFTLCEAGFYCFGGLRQQCGAGTGGVWGAEEGANVPTCSGQCDAGYYCLPGSPSATQFECGAPNLFCVRVWLGRGLSGVRARVCVAHVAVCAASRHRDAQNNFRGVLRRRRHEHHPSKQSCMRASRVRDPHCVVLCCRC